MKPTSPFRLRTSIAAALAVLAALLTQFVAPSAWAATRTWNSGAGNGNWNNANNWGGTGPGSADTAVFASTSGSQTSVFLGVAKSITSINFNSGATATFNIKLAAGPNSGGATNLTLSSGGTITVADGNSHNIGTGSFGSGTVGTLVLGGAYNIATTSGNLTIDQPTSGAYTITKTGSGNLTLSGSADNVSLALAANGGTCVFAKASATGVHSIGTSSSIGNGGTIQLGGTGDYQWYGGITLTVSSGGVLDLNGKNQNNNGVGGVLNLNGTGISSGGALINTASATTSTLTFGTGSIALQSASSIGGAGNITIASGAISGTGFALTKVGNGTLTLSGANSYTGATTISGGTLALSGGGTLATPSISIAGSATFDVSAQTTPTLAASQNLLGTGSVNGNLTTVATTVIYPATDGTVGTLTFNNNLTLNAGTKVQLDLSHTYNGTNDQIVINGNSAVLTPNGAQITIKSDGTLDTSGNDYVLINLSGSSSPSISGNFNSTPAWAGTTPSNAANYTIVTSGTQVTLHYSTSTSPTASGSATPASVTHDQTALLTVTVNPGASPTSTGLAVSADLSSIGGSATQTLYDDGTHGDVTAGDNVFSCNAAVVSGTSLGGKSLPVSITDAQSRSASAHIALTVTAASETWGATPADANWGTPGNWVSGFSPTALDLVYFDSSTQLSPNLETGYSVDSVTFNSSAGSYTIGGSTLMLTGGGVTNHSANAQTLNVPVAMGASQTINAASGDVTLGGDVSGSGKSLTKVGNSTLTLSGANSYDGGTILSTGTLIANNATTPLGTSASALHLNGGTLDLQTIGTAYNTLVGGTTTAQADNASSGPGTTKTLGSLSIGAFQLNVAPGPNATGSTAAITFGTTTLTGAATFDVAANSTLNLGAVGGAFGFTKQNSGTLVLTGTNTFGTGTVGLSLTAGTVQIGTGASYSTGNTTGVLLTVNGGTLDLNGNGIQVGNLTGSGGTILNNATGTNTTLTIGGNNLGGGNFAGVIADNSSGTGTVALSKVGSATITLSGANTYTGTTTINGGTLLLGNVNALQNTSGIIMATGTTLQPTILGVTASAPVTTAGTVKIGAPTTNSNGDQSFKEFFLNGAIGGTGNVTFNSSLNANTIQTVTLGAASTYSGTTLLDTSGGTASQIIVKLGVNDALPTTTVVTIDGQAGTGSGRVAEINLNGHNQTLAGLQNTSHTLRVQRVVNSDVSAAATLTIDGSGSSTFSGNLGSNSANFTVSPSTTPSSTNGNHFGLTKSGSGTFTLAGANSYTGATTVNGGTLALGASNALSSSTAVSIGNATLNAETFTNTVGTLNATGTATINLGTGAALAFASSNGISWAGTLNLTGTFVPGSSLRFGTDATGLTATQLGKISATGVSAFALNASGYLIVSTGQTKYAAWSSGAAFGDDTNGDGIKNGLAWVLGAANPSDNATALLPTFDNTSDVDYLIFTYRRSAVAAANTTIAVEYGSSLSGWTTAVDDGTNVIITPTTNGYATGIDKVVIKIKRTLAVDSKFFARLNVTGP